MKHHILAVFLAASLTGFVAAPALADMIAYKASLAGAQEVPANTSKGTGMIDALYDTTSKSLHWKGTYSALSGPATAAHFHGPADKGVNAGVLVPVEAPSSPFEGTAVLTDAQAADLAAGKVYFNVHTAAFPAGEIRGQMAKGQMTKSN